MFELLLLGGFLIGIWYLLCRFAGSPRGAPENSNLVNNLTATVAQTVATSVVIMVLCQSVSKNQCLASVGIASLVGSMVAYKYTAARHSIWYWIGPLIAGLIGYALASLGQDTNLSIGLPTGSFAALARPLPLDYASVGVAGAIMGYWMMTNRHAESE
jgi:branched-subunit amino acid transport protein AzlD